MIYTDLKVPASGPTNASLAAIGMAPAKWEVAGGIPFTGPSGKIFNEALAACKIPRASVFVTNLCGFFIDDNDLFSVPLEIMERERMRVFAELDRVQPKCLLVMGGDTLSLLTAERFVEKIRKKDGKKILVPIGAKEGIVKWRGSIFELRLPSGRVQKCVAAMHPSNFVRGQWKWLPLYKYIDVPRAVTQSSFSEIRLSPRTAIVGPSFHTAREALIEARKQSEVSIDYEGMRFITCLGVGWSTSQAICVPLNRAGSPIYWSLEEEAVLWKLWCELLEDPKVGKIAQNASYEWIKSWLSGIYPRNLALDTMHAHHCLYPDWGGITDEWTKRKRDVDNPGHGLALICSQYTDVPFYKDEGRHWRPEFGQEAFWRYNCLDVMVTYEAAIKMREELHSVGLWDTYQEMYRGCFEKSLQMEWDGVAFDIEERERVRFTKLAEIDTAREELQDLIKMSVITKTEKKGAKTPKGVLNLASPIQVKTFFEGRGRKIPLNRKTGRPSLDKDTLSKWALDDRVAALVLQMKQGQDFINDVLDVKLDEANRVHCHWKIGGTNGTRWASTESILGSGTNLQNLPRQGPGRGLYLPR